MKWNYNNFLEWIGNGCDQNIANNVIEFNCSNNKLTSLPPKTDQLINLQKFYCSRNKSTSLPPEISQLINLQNFDNEIKYTPPNVQRFINRLRNIHQNNQGNYYDTQSVHNHYIQECDFVNF
jgi:Leucine-rich repeat (LRR) protein